MSDIVKRLAAEREDIPGGFAMSKFMSLDDAREAEARWWINAVADELESTFGDPDARNQGADGGSNWDAARWLRRAAGEESA